MKIRSGLCILAFALSSGAVSAAEVDKSQFSGFLGDYSQLEPAKDREGILLYLNNTADYSPYKKVMFAPVEIYLTPNPDYKGLQPDVLKQMSDGFLDSFISALAPDYQIAKEAGPDVLTIRIAITGVQLTKPAMGVTDFIPIKALYNLGRSAAGDAPMVAEMTAEIEALGADGTRLAAAVATRKGEKTLKQGEQITWKELQAITDYWAKGMKQRLDQVRDTKR
jgi:hypothetical protein